VKLKEISHHAPTRKEISGLFLGKIVPQKEIRSRNQTVRSLESARVGVPLKHGQRTTEVRYGGGGTPGNSLGGAVPV